MKVSNSGLELIKSFEGCRYKAYQDVGGVWTIGYGHTGPKVFEGLLINEEIATELLKADIARFEAGVTQAVRVDLTQGQFDALVSFAFNVGMGAFTLSTMNQLLNQGKYKDAADQLLRWNKVKGKVVRGLTERRLTERLLFLGELH